MECANQPNHRDQGILFTVQRLLRLPLFAPQEARVGNLVAIRALPKINMAF